MSRRLSCDNVRRVPVYGVKTAVTGNCINMQEWKCEWINIHRQLYESAGATQENIFVRKYASFERVGYLAVCQWFMLKRDIKWLSLCRDKGFMRAWSGLYHAMKKTLWACNMSVIRVQNGPCCNGTKRKPAVNGINMRFIYMFSCARISILQKKIVKIFYFLKWIYMQF